VGYSSEILVPFKLYRNFTVNSEDNSCVDFCKKSKQILNLRCAYGRVENFGWESNYAATKRGHNKPDIFRVMCVFSKGDQVSCRGLVVSQN
jgi:hypothetical protein